MKTEEFKKLRDVKFYLENFCRIKPKKPGALVPFILNEAQKDLFNTVNRHNRVIILKARQLGFSTAMVGWMYHNTIMNSGTNTAIIGYNSDLTAELLDKVKTFLQSTPSHLRPTVEYNSKYEMSFPRMNSKILVLPSTVNVGRGYTLHNVLATELASWENAEEKMMTLEASVPIEGKLVIESTPIGEGNHYHMMWVNDNDYIKKKYGWWWGYNRLEIGVIRKRMNNPQLFAQEYGLSFLASGRSVFDKRMIIKMRSNVKRLGEKILLEDKTIHTVNEVKKLRIYKPPVDGEIYVISGDVSEGIEGGDYSFATVWNRKTGEEVAMFKGLVPPDVFGEMLNEWGRKYNNALMIVEVNNHGLTTLTILKQLLYPSLYFRLSKLEGTSLSSSDKLGWRTTRVTRPLMIDEFAQACRGGDLIIHSKEILDEMSVFVYDDNGNMCCPRNFHDDGIFSSAMAVQGFKMVSQRPLTQINYEEHLPSSYSY